MYKFQSMCMDAETKLKDLLKHNEVEGAMFKLKNDPRVTKIGKFIQKTSIVQYDKQCLFIKPGCTGIWQISGKKIFMNYLDGKVYFKFIHVYRYG